MTMMVRVINQQQQETEMERKYSRNICNTPVKQLRQVFLKQGDSAYNKMLCNDFCSNYQSTEKSSFWFAA